MDLVFDISSSMQFWRTRYPATSVLKPSEAPPPECPATAATDMKTLMPAWVDDAFLEYAGGQFHAMAFGHEGRRQTNAVVVHTWSGDIAPGSFYELKPHVFIAAPEFTFFVAASCLSIRKLIALGDELCGLYGFDARSKRGLRKREVPLTDKERLSRYLDQVLGCHGSKKAATALRHVVERSGSPMETFDVMSLCLPRRLGGYGLREPEMNRYMNMDPAAALIAHSKRCAPDLGWFDEKFAIEHLGVYDHSEPDKVLADRARVNAIKAMGFEVIELTNDQVNDLLTFEAIARIAANRTGKRLRKDALGPIKERLLLRQELREWNRSYGRIR